MSLYEEMKAEFVFQDNRGRLTQLTHQDWQQVNVLESHQGTVRGGHYHKRVREAFFVITGSVCLRLRSVCGQEVAEEQTFHAGAFFLVPPYTAHSMFFPEDCVLVALYDKSVEDEDGVKDIWPEEV